MANIFRINFLDQIFMDDTGVRMRAQCRREAGMGQEESCLARGSNQRRRKISGVLRRAPILLHRARLSCVFAEAELR